MLVAIVSGACAGAGMGYVLQRAQLCFHAMFEDAWAGRGALLRVWLLAVAVASVGLSILYLTPYSRGLNRGLPFLPVSDILGGLIIGVGMVIANSCVSGMFYKLGSGMFGALVGIGGWVAGELVARHLHIPGPTALPGGDAATFAAVLHLPRLLLAVAFLVGTIAVLWRWRPSPARPETKDWGWPVLGIALGGVTVAGWLLARAGHSSFGPSTVGAAASVAAGHPNYWLIAFLVAIVFGAFAAARTRGGWWRRGETPLRLGGLAVGGFLLGAGGWIAGGCNLGHGLSGVSQLNVSSWVVVAAMASGVLVARTVVRAVGSSGLHGATDSDRAPRCAAGAVGPVR